MGEQTYSIFFSGLALPGFDLEQVQQQATQLMKLSPTQLATLFSGREVCIRKNITQSVLQHYQTLLRDVGMDVDVRPDPKVIEIPIQIAETEIALTAKSQNNTEASTLAIAEKTAVEEVICPACGEKQPKRTLCRACSIDMPRYAEAQRQLKVEATQPIASASSVLIYGDAHSMDADPVPFWSMRFFGRVGRLRFFAFLAVQFLLTILVLFFWAKKHQQSLVWTKADIGIVLLFLAIGLWQIRAVVLRLHDIGWNGWFWILVILVSPLFLALLLIPGDKNANMYGSPDRADIALGSLFAGAFSIILAVFILNVFMPQLKLSNKSMAFAMKGEDKSEATNHSARAQAPIVLYATSTCPYCEQAREWFSQHGIAYKECNVEVTESCQRRFRSLGGNGVPLVEWGDILESGFSEESYRQIFLKD